MWSARDVVARIVELPERSGRSPTGAEPTLARVTRYGVAVVLTAGAWAATLGLTPTLPAANFLPFAAAVALATWYGGIGPGLLTSALSIAAIDFSFLPPIGSVELTHSEEWLDSGVFLVVALTISATTVALRHARRLADGGQSGEGRGGDEHLVAGAAHGHSHPSPGLLHDLALQERDQARIALRRRDCWRWQNATATASAAFGSDGTPSNPCTRTNARRRTSLGAFPTPATAISRGKHSAGIVPATASPTAASTSTASGETT